MTSLHDQLAAFAQAHGGTLRYGPQPARPIPERRDLAGEAPQTIPERRDLADPLIEYTDDYSLWARTRRG